MIHILVPVVRYVRINGVVRTSVTYRRVPYRVIETTAEVVASG